ncbi:MAG: Fic family protein [Kofleriaceae bacterium]
MTWAELDPSTHPFDKDEAEVVIVQAVAGFKDQFGDASVRGSVANLLQRSIVTHAGEWAAGWTWAATEPGGGGPVNGWCCESDSVFREDDPDWRTTATRALNALIDWREYLEELAIVFAHLRAETGTMDVERELGTAIQKIIGVVVERTAASDAWYHTLETAVRWYVELAGLHATGNQTLAQIVERAVSGHFESWVAPSRENATANSQTIAAQLAHQVEAEQRDALAAWRIARTRRPAAIIAAQPDLDSDEPDRTPTKPRPVLRLPDDEHLRFIEHQDRARDPLRADRMAAALLLARDAAAQPLSFDLLSEWQRVVLGERAPVPFRTTTAYAKRGREEYGFASDVPEAFDAALAEANDPALHATVRAARVYLDVCFFHPFPDGNARAARLALDHTLTAGGLRLTNAAAVFQIVRSPELGLWELARVIQSTTARFR